MPAPGSGSKTEMVTIERVTRTPDGGGGVTTAWASIGDLWADVQWVRGSETETRGAVREVVVYRFRVLTDDAEAIGITAKDRIVWCGDLYNIRERPRRSQRIAETDIIAEMGVAQ